MANSSYTGDIYIDQTIAVGSGNTGLDWSNAVNIQDAISTAIAQHGSATNIRYILKESQTHTISGLILYNTSLWITNPDAIDPETNYATISNSGSNFSFSQNASCTNLELHLTYGSSDFILNGEGDYKFQNCIFKRTGPGGNSLFFDGGSGQEGLATFENCKFYNNGDTISIGQIECGISGTNDESGMAFINCYFENFGTIVVNSNHSYFIFKGPGILVSNCVFYSTDRYLQLLAQGQTTFGANTFINNTFYFTKSDAGETPYLLYNTNVSNSPKNLTFHSNAILTNITPNLSNNILDGQGGFYGDNYYQTSPSYGTFVGDSSDVIIGSVAGFYFKSLININSEFMVPDADGPSPLIWGGRYGRTAGAKEINAYPSSGGLPALDAEFVKIDYDRGDGVLGTYDGSDRWSDAGENNVKKDVTYKANSLIENKIGNRTDAQESNVLVTNGTYGANGTELTPTYNPDFPEVDNVRETDTVNGIPGTLENNEILTTSSGNYINPDESIVKITENYGVNQIGTYEAVCDYPANNKVLDKTLFNNGLSEGTLGAVNTDNLDITKQIAYNMSVEIKNIYPILEDLAYVEDLAKNNFRGNKNRLGIRALDLEPTKELVGRETIDRSFEIILTTDFVNKKASDINAREAKNTLIERAEYIRRKMRTTKAGSYQNVRITRSFIENEAEFIENEGVCIIRMQITVNYRVNT